MSGQFRVSRWFVSIAAVITTLVLVVVVVVLPHRSDSAAAASKSTLVSETVASPTSETSLAVETLLTSQTRATSDAASAVSTMSPKQLAGRLMLVGVASTSLTQVHRVARDGIGGVVLFGTPPLNLRQQLRRLKALSPDGRLIVSSDEEGGQVQRLARLLGRLPSASTIGQTRSVAQARALAARYARKLAALGVTLNLAPVADVKYPGSWTDRDGRAYRTDPVENGRYVAAFIQGMHDGSVMATAKHWPGGGAVVDTHRSAGKTPAWSQLQRRDLVPFEAAFAAGVDAVMVSHARVPGLSGGLPATQSAAALDRLRGSIDDTTLIVTDSLAMAAVTGAMRQKQATAAVRAIAAGADLALIQGDTLAVRKALAKAIRDGRIPRAQAEASVARVLAAAQG